MIQLNCLRVPARRLVAVLTVALGVAVTPAAAFYVAPQQTLYDFGLVPLGTTASRDVIFDIILAPGESLTLAPVLQINTAFSMEPGPCQLSVSGQCTFAASFPFASQLFPFVVYETIFTFNTSGAALNGDGPGVGPVSRQDFVELRAVIEETPLPAALPLFAGGLGALALLGWRKKQKAAAALAGA